MATLKINWPAPFEGLRHETIETAQHPFGAAVLNDLGAGKAQWLSCSTSMPAYLEIGCISEWPTTSTITLGGTIRATAEMSQRQELELKPGRELDDARVLGCGVLAELRVD